MLNIFVVVGEEEEGEEKANNNNKHECLRGGGGEGRANQPTTRHNVSQSLFNVKATVSM